MNPISFLRGVPADDALQPLVQVVEKGYSDALKKYGGGVLQYRTNGLTDFNGFIPLKETLAKRYGVDGDPSEKVICFNGGMEALSFLFKSYPRGSKVATEALTYDRALIDAARYDHEVVGIPFGPEGIDLTALDKALGSGDVEFFYRVIYHQNPTGYDSSPANIDIAAEICAKHNVLYVCDVAYYELRYDGVKNRLIDISKHPDTTCLLGSFTKTFSPGTKCGFGIFPPSVVDKLTDIVANTRLNPNYPTQAMIHSVMESGEYDKYLDFLTTLYFPRMDALNDALDTSLPAVVKPRLTGGFFCGIWLPGIKDEQAFIDAADAKGINLASSKVFVPEWKAHYFKKYGGHFYRLTFPAIRAEAIEEGIGRLGEVYSQLM